MLNLRDSPTASSPNGFRGSPTAASPPSLQATPLSTGPQATPLSTGPQLASGSQRTSSLSSNPHLAGLTPHSPGSAVASGASTRASPSSRRGRRSPHRSPSLDAEAERRRQHDEDSFFFFWFSGSQFMWPGRQSANRRRPPPSSNNNNNNSANSGRTPENRPPAAGAGVKDFLEGDDDGDLADYFESDVDGGVAVEDQLRAHWPIFTVVQCTLVFLLWCGTALPDSDWSAEAFVAVGGLEIIFPGRTTMVVHQDCEDLRAELWRWWTYQFTHTKFSHVASNVFLAIVAGIPLEGFGGTRYMLLLFNLGVVGGAACHGVSNPHLGSSQLSSDVRVVGLVGMSGGCYALLGMHMGCLLMNFRQVRYRWPILLGLLVLIVLDIIYVQLDTEGGGVVAHSAHLGGYIAGLLMSIILGRNEVWTRKERFLQALTMLIVLGLCTFTIIWLAAWPPRSIHDGVPWCAVRQVNNRTLFGDLNFHCVRCETQECLANWLQQTFVQGVNHELCSARGLWADT